jgi:hypothetical protein
MAIDKITASGLGDGGVSTADIADGAVTAAKLDSAAVTPTAVSDAPNTSTGGLTLPSGTSGQRPGSPDTGESRMNTTNGSLEYYDGTNWISTNLIPNISSITGNIFNSSTSNLVFAITNNTDTVDVVFSEGGSAFHTVTDQAVSSGAFTLAVPSQAYGQTAGDTISITIRNSDGTPSGNAVTKTVLAPPSGGTITTSGAYRIHTFTSSGTFVVTSALTNVEYLVIAGGGGGGVANGGGAGGGAGGYRNSTGSENSGRNSSTESKLSLGVANYTVTIGAGGAGGPINSNGDRGVQGSSTVFGSITSIGGGYGGGDANRAGGAGGSGGGAARNNTTEGAGTAGQGFNGGDGSGGNEGGGGGGAGQVGGTAIQSPPRGGNGGNGLASSITGSSVTRAGGGGGGAESPSDDVGGIGGTGGGGKGGQAGSVGSVPTAGTVNTGSGGGGSGDWNTGGNHTGKAGGSGIVIVRYQL